MQLRAMQQQRAMAMQMGMMPGPVYMGPPGVRRMRSFWQ